MSYAGIHSCEICGTPFEPRNCKQKTCGAPECKEEYHRRYVAEYNRVKRAKNPEACRQYNRVKMRAYRNKQRELEDRDAQLQEVADRWKKQEEFSKKIAEYGHRYGEVSAQKVLATVPKIDVNLEGRRHDHVHDQDGRS